MQIKFSIILPCYNEYGNLKYLVPAICKCFKKKTYEIIIVDDNSPDQTIKRLKIDFKKMKSIKYFLRKKNPSLGLSIKTGIEKSKGNSIVVMDSDFNHRPVDLKKLLNLFSKDNFDMVCGSRFLKGGYSVSIFRHFTSLLFNIFLNLITSGKMTDNLSGFFIIKKKFLVNKIDKIFYGYGEYYIRLLFFLQRNINIAEIPVSYGKRKYGVSKSKLMKMFFLYTSEAIKLLK
jgi:dolichol-phosphate mannosyltransferase|tara:strand:- start:20 stop:712 length:693 start_codon:yes stop_codon:yes gene_type:complete